MSAVSAGVADVDAKFEEIIDFCLGCRACEPVCPGMVPYGFLLEGARNEITAQRPSTHRRLRRLLLGRLIGEEWFMRLATIGARVGRRRWVASLAPGRIRRALSGLRPISRVDAPKTKREGKEATVGLLLGCVQGSWFGTVNNAAAELLELAGHPVVVPESQTCCGALAAHDGHAVAASRFEARNGAAFADCDRVVATAAGCSAHLSDVMANASDAIVLVAEAILDGRLPRLSESGERATVQDPCHHNHAQGINTETRLIVEAAGYEVVELNDDGLCCGAAGLYTVLQPEASEILGQQKANLIEDRGVELVVSGNPGCEMQLRSALGKRFRITHPLELYASSLNPG